MVKPKNAAASTAKTASTTIVKGVTNVKPAAIFNPTGRVTLAQFNTWLKANAANQLNRCVIQQTPYFVSLGITNWQQYVNNTALNALSGSLCTKHPLTGHKGAPSIRAIQLLCLLFGVSTTSLPKANNNGVVNPVNKSVAGGNLATMPHWGGYNNAKNICHGLHTAQAMLSALGGKSLTAATSSNTLAKGNTFLQLLSGTGSSKASISNPALIQVAVAPAPIVTK